MLNAKLAVSKSITIPPIDCILSIPWIFKAHKGKGYSASIVLQLNVSDFAIFEEYILNVPLLHISWKVTHVDPAICHDVN